MLCGWEGYCRSGRKYRQQPTARFISKSHALLTSQRFRPAPVPIAILSMGLTPSFYNGSCNHKQTSWALLLLARIWWHTDGVIWYAINDFMPWNFLASFGDAMTHEYICCGSTCHTGPHAPCYREHEQHICNSSAWSNHTGTSNNVVTKHQQLKQLGKTTF